MSSNSGTTALREMLTSTDRKGIMLDSERVQSALRTVEEIYGDKLHWSKEKTTDHIIGTLEILLPFQPDEDAVIACLLHHSLFDGGLTLIELEQSFGPKVRSLVSGVHLLSHVTVRGRRTPIEDLRLMLLTVSDDIRTILISLCDRCHLLDRTEELESDDRRRICQDALQLFAPVAARLGIYSLKHRLESHAFPVLYPNDAERINMQVSRMYKQHGNFIDGVATYLTDALKAQGMKDVTIVSREKQLYSIFMKMRHKSLSHIQDVYDFYALRVVVDTVEECYQALGIIHSVGRPISHRFKDYISFPKPNGYQSLHTTLARVPGAPSDIPIEIQVRTKDMHREAEFGVAAHWSYKAYGSTEHAVEHAQLQHMLASQEILDEGGGQSRLVDHIFVLSPKGDIIELPEGATPLDFAFQVHTDLGLSFRGARVNGAMVPIDHELENGDVIEILKHKIPKPSPQWFQLLKLSSARSRLKRYLYIQERPALITQGRQLVNELLHKHSMKRLDQELSILRLCDGEVLSFQQREDLLMKIGQGSERVSSLIDRLEVFRTLSTANNKNEELIIVEEKILPPKSNDAVELEGGVPMPTRFAKCCKPDEKHAKEIVGVINRAGIVLVHGKTCGMLRNANPARIVKAQWSN